jgi:hypothetical protein
VLNDVNYVVLVYDEAQTNAEAHEADGTTQYTKASVSPRLTILTEAAYDALSASNDVLSTNAADRAMLVAKVTANGVGVALTAGSIESPTVYSETLEASQPLSITGVVILAVDPTTPTGLGTLAFQISGPNKQLKWTAPGDSAGSFTTVSDGANSIASGSGYTLDLDVVVSALPAGATSEIIEISNIYQENVPRFSAEDHQHRNLRGTGIPTTVNPHGMTIDDLSPGAAGSVETHQDLMHANGIVKTSSPTLLAGTVNTGVAPDTLTIGGFSAGDTVYINGRRLHLLM